MTVTIRNLVGTRENLDKVFDYHLTDDWTSSNVGGVTPDIENSTDDPDFLARQDYTGPNKIFINVSSRLRTTDSENDPNGDGSHEWKTEITFDLWGESLEILGLMEDEVNRIIWELAPSNSTRLTKSNGQNSEVQYFENSEVEFARIEPEGELDTNPSSQGFLTVVWFKDKS
tara:strand:- start:30 stop:545 length:516 start_codon:yes stop_codon:yes gene_type:complete